MGTSSQLSSGTFKLPSSLGFGVCFCLRPDDCHYCVSGFSLLLWCSVPRIDLNMMLVVVQAEPSTVGYQCTGHHAYRSFPSERHLKGSVVLCCTSPFASLRGCMRGLF